MEIKVDNNYLEYRMQLNSSKGWTQKPKWIEFCETMINSGFSIKMYEARRSVSKYITVYKNKKEFKVRFSNHKPIKIRENIQDCDFFVGINNSSINTTDQAIEAVYKFFDT